MSQISEKYHKDYKNITFDNPRLQRQRENKAEQKKKIFFGLIAIGVVLMMYLLFFSPIFSIKSFEINGLNKVKRESIDSIINEYRSERRFLIFSKNNFWVFNRTDLKEKISKQYYFDQLVIKRKFPATIVITLKEKQPAITWLTNNLCYNLDEVGTAIEYCDKASANMTISDPSNVERMIGDSVLTPEDTKKLLGLDSMLQDVVANKFQITNFEKNNNLLIAKTNQLLELRFDLTADVGEQLERLTLLLGRKDVIDSIKQIQYIDLRFGEKIYLK